ncbi:hypothetical protein EV652_12150 [Kribbella steppae]|uniref:Uncharacterized protein n=1 Tax=Kribbella steppae TaxID=2512223 RepID=A0A4R2GXA9_9ACTN|nr:hypothetical protein [Kribbella steppae]TCO15677.1 hypothetical protein EV652_12150 [Kribbella steppae]
MCSGVLRNGYLPTAARRYLTDDALADLARTMVVGFADETPGADVIEHVRTIVAHLPQTLSAVGQVIADRTPAPPVGASVVMMPPGLVNRAGRYLEAAASLVSHGVLPEGFNGAHADQLAATFVQDAVSLRYCTGELPDV